MHRSFRKITIKKTFLMQLCLLSQIFIVIPQVFLELRKTIFQESITLLRAQWEHSMNNTKLPKFVSLMKIGTIFSNLHISGKFRFSKDLFINFASGKETIFLVCFRRIVGILLVVYYYTSVLLPAIKVMMIFFYLFCWCFLVGGVFAKSGKILIKELCHLWHVCYGLIFY